MSAKKPPSPNRPMAMKEVEEKSRSESPRRAKGKTAPAAEASKKAGDDAPLRRAQAPANGFERTSHRRNDPSLPPVDPRSGSHKQDLTDEDLSFGCPAIVLFTRGTRPTYEPGPQRAD